MNPAASLTPARRAPRTGGQQNSFPWPSEIRAHVARHAALVRHPARWSTRGRAFAALLAVYVVTIVLVLVPGTFLQHIDIWVVEQHFGSKHASWLWWVKIIVGFGQRWIITDVLQVLIVFACLRARSVRPMVHFVVALVLINASVGVVKNSIGRIGPFNQSNDKLNAHRIFELGGDIFPSGHVSNAVVMFGVLAMAVPRYRRALATFAVLASVGVGLGTIYMRTHWVSDVIGGWLAGGLVLLAIPSVMPWAERFADQFVAWVRAAVHRRPRLHRVCHAVLHWLLRHVPQDHGYWAQRPARVAGRHRRDDRDAAEEFDDWPQADGSLRELETVAR